MTLLSDIGEKEAVRRILAKIDGRSPVGPGDDAAAVEVGGRYIVASTDVVTRSKHLPQLMSDRDMGWMAAAVNYSDIAAMGAEPLGLLLAFALPPDSSFESLEKMMEGAQACSRSVGAEVIGGDTKESDVLSITGTALGAVDKDRMLLRKGAHKGDLLAVTGTIGLAAAGYRAMEAGMDCPKALEALLRPVPRIAEGMILSSSRAVTSCMDITDGLAYSVHQLSQASGVHFEVDWNAIPVEAEVFDISRRIDADVQDLVLYYGGDYQLLFTFKAAEIGNLVSLLGSKFTVIGRAASSNNVLIKCGQIVPLEDRGYEHFKAIL